MCLSIEYSDIVVEEKLFKQGRRPIVRGVASYGRSLGLTICRTKSRRHFPLVSMLGEPACARLDAPGVRTWEIIQTMVQLPGMDIAAHSLEIAIPKRKRVTQEEAQ